jgi:NADPH:quinone reductase-like Zn-dependent oxidoreductase
VLTELPDPQPGPGEVKVDLIAAALNRREWWIRTGGKVRLPAVLGSDGAGIVSAVGPGVEWVSVGDQVVIYPGIGWGDADNAAAECFTLVGVPGQGTYAEQIVVRAEQVRPRPPGWSWLETAALPVAALTAWRALVTCARAGPDKTVLVTGAGGGVATFAIQIGAALGARIVVTTSSPKKLQRARALGAADGGDYRDPGWPDRLRPADAVIDSVGGDVWRGALASLCAGGVLVTFGDTGDELGSIPIADFFFRYLRVQGTTLGSPREFDALLAHCAEASWRPAIDSVYPLAEAAKAHERLEAPDRFGKVLLAIDEQRAGG